MHHAFPRECAYPQQSGAAMAPMTADEWMQVTGHASARKTDQEMQHFIVNSDSSILPVGAMAREHQDLPENELPWDGAEELLNPRKKKAAQRSAFHNDDVVTLISAPKETKPSPINSAVPMAAVASLILSVAAFAWKMIPQNSKLADGALV